MKLRAQTIEQSLLLPEAGWMAPQKYGNKVRKSSPLSDALGNNKALRPVLANKMLIPLG
jgi:hypothetical protein